MGSHERLLRHVCGSELLRALGLGLHTEDRTISLTVANPTPIHRRVLLQKDPRLHTIDHG